MRPVRVFLSVCTYRRNDELRRLLESMTAAAAEAGDGVDVGVVIVDDNGDGRAAPIAEEFGHRFSLGVRYRNTGSGNISVARNAGLEAVVDDADWVALTDDDCVVPPGWLREHLATAARHGCDAVTGSMLLRFPEDGPQWLHDEPFDTIGLLDTRDGDRMIRCATNNSLLAADWLRMHPDVRFDPALGTTGGEDMVFSRAAVQAGLHVRFSAAAPVYELEPASRATLRYQLIRAMWMGNTECLTNLRAGDAGRGRLAVRGLNKARRALARPPARLLRRRRPQLRFALAQLAQAFGLLVGVAGHEMRHR